MVRVVALPDRYIAWCGAGRPVAMTDPWLAAYFAVAFALALGGVP